MADPEIKIKRYADKENLKELIKYCKATFASKDGSTSGGGTVDLSNYYTKSEVDDLLRNVINYSGNSITKEEIEEICVL